MWEERRGGEERRGRVGERRGRVYVGGGERRGEEAVGFGASAGALHTVGTSLIQAVEHYDIISRGQWPHTHKHTHTHTHRCTHSVQI